MKYVVENRKLLGQTGSISICISQVTPLENAGGTRLATVTPTNSHFCLTESNEQVINPCQLLLKPGQADPNASY